MIVFEERKEVVELLRKNGNVLNYLDKSLKDDEEIVLAAI